MAGKGREWAKASHLRGGLASHQGFPKIGGSIAMATIVFGFSFYIFKRWRGYIFIVEEGNGRGYLGIPKVPYI